MKQRIGRPTCSGCTALGLVRSAIRTGSRLPFGNSGLCSHEAESAKIRMIYPEKGDHDEKTPRQKARGCASGDDDVDRINKNANCSE